MNRYLSLVRPFIDLRVHLGISSNDLVLCEFPKSGVTYFSFLIANYLLALEQSEVEVNFFNINNFVQDLHRTPSIDKSIQFKSARFRILKSHASYGFLKYPQKIVLIRNPVKTLQSYYRHIQASSASALPGFNVFLRTHKFGVNAWLRFYSVHLRDSNPLGQALFCFEDNIQFPITALQKFCALTGVKYCPDSARTASAHTALEKMKLSEDQSSRLGFVKPKFRFVGASGSSIQDSLAQDSVDYIYTRIKNSQFSRLVAPEILEKICPGI